MNQSTYTPLKEPIQITEHKWADDISPLVCVRIMAYNHESFIRECIEGILIQKTNFPVRVLIHDDASTDNTANIIREYENQHPHLLKVIYQKVNTYSKPDKFQRRKKIAEILDQSVYTALCEGDDYWTDPLKLQKQVDFLEENKEYGVIHGDCNNYFQETNTWEFNINKNLSNKTEIRDKEELFFRLLDADYKIRTATVLYRRELHKKRLPNKQTFLMGDTPLWLDFSQMTKFKYIDEVLAVYRILPESASQSKSMLKLYTFRLSMAEMRIYYCEKYNYPINDKLCKRYNEALINLKIFKPDYNEKYPPKNLSFIDKTRYTLACNKLTNPLYKFYRKIRGKLSSIIKK